MSKLSLLDEAIADNTRQVLVYVLKQIVVLLHPFAPFISDEIYQAIPGNLGSIHKESWPNIPSKYFFIIYFKQRRHNNSTDHFFRLFKERQIM